MNNNEIIFSYFHHRCHAAILEGSSGDDYLKEIKESGKELIYIGQYDKYYVYEIKSILFNQFGFIASHEKLN